MSEPWSEQCRLRLRGTGSPETGSDEVFEADDQSEEVELTVRATRTRWRRSYGLKRSFAGVEGRGVMMSFLEPACEGGPFVGEGDGEKETEKPRSREHSPGRTDPPP